MQAWRPQQWPFVSSPCVKQISWLCSFTTPVALDASQNNFRMRRRGWRYKTNLSFLLTTSSFHCHYPVLTPSCSSSTLALSILWRRYIIWSSVFAMNRLPWLWWGLFINADDEWGPSYLRGTTSRYLVIAHVWGRFLHSGCDCSCFNISVESYTYKTWVLPLSSLHPRISPSLDGSLHCDQNHSR